MATVKIIRTLGDLKLLKSYLLLVLSEWDFPDLRGTCTAIQEDFGGIGMMRHREDLLRHLDHVLGQLDLGTEHFRRHNTNIYEVRIDETKKKYEELNAVLLEVDGEAMKVLTREPPGSFLFVLFNLLSLVDVYRMPLEFCVCPPSPMSIDCTLRCFFIQNLRHPLPFSIAFRRHNVEALIDDGCHSRVCIPATITPGGVMRALIRQALRLHALALGIGSLPLPRRGLAGPVGCQKRSD